MPKIKVYPTHEDAFFLVHPIDGPISDEGSHWEHDAFTARMLHDNAVTLDLPRAHKFERRRPDPSLPPAHATGSGVPVVQTPPAAPDIASDKKKG